jgi:dihydroorotate dehydrogenase (fumarate)
MDGVKRLEDAGCAAVVLPSVFEEQVSLAREGRIAHMDPNDERFAEMIGYFPARSEYRFGPHEYAEHLYRVTQAVKIPVIGSINGHTRESWLTFAPLIEQAGAAALEVNWYEVHTDARALGIAIEDELVEMVHDVKRIVKIPLAIKLSPFFTAVANVAHQIDEAGADGLVLFNRFYQPDIDIRTMQVMPHLELSTSAELPLRLRWIAILCGRVRASLAITGGVTTPEDGIKAVLAGADAVQMVSALLHHGPSRRPRGGTRVLSAALSSKPLLPLFRQAAHRWHRRGRRTGGRVGHRSHAAGRNRPPNRRHRTVLPG